MGAGFFQRVAAGLCHTTWDGNRDPGVSSLRTYLLLLLLFLPRASGRKGYLQSPCARDLLHESARPFVTLYWGGYPGPRSPIHGASLGCLRCPHVVLGLAPSCPQTARCALSPTLRQGPGPWPWGLEVQGCGVRGLPVYTTPLISTDMVILLPPPPVLTAASCRPSGAAGKARSGGTSLGHPSLGPGVQCPRF